MLTLWTHPLQPILLGAPIGEEQQSISYWTVKVQEMERLGERLKQLNAHDDLFLLRNSCSLPNLLYICVAGNATIRIDSAMRPRSSSRGRNTSASVTVTVTRFHDCVRATLQSVLNVALSDNAWRQSTLPRRAVLASGRQWTWLYTVVPLSASAELVSRLLPTNLHDISYQSVAEAEQ